MNEITLKDGVYSLIDLKSKESMHLYYGLKNRFEYVVEDRTGTIKAIADAIRHLVMTYDFIVYPESSSSFLEDVLAHLKIDRHKVSKTSMDDIIKYAGTLNLQKKESESHHERFQLMNGTFKINQMKSTQRKKYEDVIFNKVNLPVGKGLIVDDSHFSGTTYRALVTVTGIHDFLAIFSK